MRNHMIDDDIRQLDQRERDHSLSQLESDIWRGVAARARRREATRRITSFQGVIVVFALFGSAAAGLRIVQPVDTPSAVGVLASGIDLMPSSLLLGQPR